MEGHKQEDEQEEEDFFEVQEIVIDKKQEPTRIDKFLMNRLYKISRNKLQNYIKSGSITVNEETIKPNFKVKYGHTIKMVLPKFQGDTELVAQDLNLDIHYEDEDLLLVHKPPGMVVHPGVGNPDRTLVNGLAHYLGLGNVEMEDQSFQEKIGLVHRIDKNTSGLLLVAKNDYALSHLAKQFFNHTIERTYYALVWGQPEPEIGKVEAHIGRHPRYRDKHAAFPEGDQGKWAVTHYEVIEPMYYVSLVKCNLETGRTHQIRVHMQHLGHPLFNDDRYGGDRIRKGTIYSKYKRFVENTFDLMPRHALHAKSLGFIHPRTEEFMQFETELPADFTAALDSWRNYLSHRKET
ncbi:MAG: RluA family pseudouridine synthase [Saprospiraceae bacterium]